MGRDMTTETQPTAPAEPAQLPSQDQRRAVRAAIMAERAIRYEYESDQDRGQTVDVQTSLWSVYGCDVRRTLDRSDGSVAYSARLSAPRWDGAAYVPHPWVTVLIE